MFFLVEHSWDANREAEVSRETIQLMLDCHHGKIGDPWPKLFNIWQDPRSPRIIALWEASSLKSLEETYQKFETFRHQITHVRQLYPPHVGCYNVMRIQTDPNLPHW